MGEIIQLVRERIGLIVTRGLDAYGLFPIEEDKRRFYQIAVDLLLRVTDRIEMGEFVTISPLKPKLVSGLFVSGFESNLAQTLFGLVAQSLYDEIDTLDVVDLDTVRVYRKYESLLDEAFSDLDSLLVRSVPEYLNGLAEYGVSDEVVNLGRSKSRLLRVNRTAHTLSTTFTSRLGSKFSSVFDQNVRSVSGVVSNASPDINAITSDSKLNAELPGIDRSLLSATFAGEGPQIYSDIERLYDFAMEFGGYEGSLAGSADYQHRYYEYLMAMCYGKRLPGGLLGGQFGRFEDIFEIRTTDGRIAGLRFLEPLYKNRSANQSTEPGNPLVAAYGSGLTDRYVAPLTTRTDTVTLILESVYVACLKVGDGVRSIMNREPVGIGDTSLHMEALARVFPQSVDVRDRETGFTGAIGSLLRSYRSLYALLGTEPNLNGIDSKLKTMSGLLSDLVTTIRSAGFKPGDYVPSLALTFYEPQREKIEKRLTGIGFNRAEVQEIMSAGSMSELIDRFAPITDSQDVISFFRAYDLTKLLYEFGGQEAIDRYTDYLYGVDSESSLLRLLELLDRGRSLASTVKGSEYAKLIGYMVTLTYAVDPDQLMVLDSILNRNNLDLFESITQLVERGVPTVVKDRDAVSLLSGTVAQMVTLDNTGYESQKPLWNDLIERSAGNADRTELSGLYERVEGITPTELYRVLNGPSATSPLGKLLDGVRGGRLTSLLRYCNLFGLLYTLSPYRNSGQLVNEPAERFVSILELLDNMEVLSERLDVAHIVTGELAESDTASNTLSDTIVQVQNKEFTAMVDLVRGNNPSASIAESPGIGNSRVPNGVRMADSLTPEEAALISSAGRSVGAFTSVRAEDGSYVRVAVSNLLAGGVVVRGSELSTVTTPGPSGSDPVPDYTTGYAPSTGSGATTSRSSFDPVESCRRFGGTGCEELGYDTASLCNTGYGKALFPEDGYGSESLSPGSVLVDRALGTQLSRTVTYNAVPPTHPQRGFTAHGLSEMSRSGVLKDTEMACAALKDPYEYGACMSLLKCKKFRPPYEGRYWFEFCPSTLHGGRLKP